MKMLRWLCKKFKCKSSCVYNVEEEIFNDSVMRQSLDSYQLKIKDIKTIVRILNKREGPTPGSSPIPPKSEQVTALYKRMTINI